MEASAADRLAIARRYLEIGNPKRALAEVEKGGADFENSKFWAIRAEALFDLKRWREAGEAARRGLEIEPHSIMLLDILAICQLNLGKKKEAEKRVRAALELAPQHPTLLAHHAVILAKSKRFDEAQSALDEASRLAPESTDVVMARAQVTSMRGDRRRAGESADQLLQLEPDSDLSHLTRGAVDMRSARFKHAVRHFEEAARLNPDKPGVRDALREARVGANPLLAPVRPVWRFGRMRSWLVYITIASALAFAHLYSLRYAIAGVWITACVLSWVAPPILRRWYDRKRRVF